MGNTLDVGLAADPGVQILSQLRENVALQRVLADAGDVDAFTQTDADFHTLLVRGSRNQAAQQFYSQLRDRQYRMQAYYLHIGPAMIRAALADHEAMLASVERGDADELCRLITSHLQRHRGGMA